VPATWLVGVSLFSIGHASATLFALRSVASKALIIILGRLTGQPARFANDQTRPPGVGDIFAPIVTMDSITVASIGSDANPDRLLIIL